jgi:hypothetical protein
MGPQPGLFNELNPHPRETVLKLDPEYASTMIERIECLEIVSLGAASNRPSSRTDYSFARESLIPADNERCISSTVVCRGR